MTENKKIIIVIVILSFTISSSGQKIKYKDYEDDISTKNYRETINNPKYSPLLAGICNYVFPSAGYFYVGEPIRGACVLGSELIIGSVSAYGLIMSMSVDSETGKSPKGARTILYSGIIAYELIQIWSIYDVVKVAKIKNLAYQDKNLSIMVKPELFFVNQNNRNIATYGLILSLNF